MSQQSSKIAIALSKGRILNESLPLLAASGIELKQSVSDSRKLIFETSHPDVRLLVIRASDVPTFTAYGAADVGIVGKDVLLENNVDNLYELADLRIARCRLALASLPDTDLHQSRLRIATKYTGVTREWFARQGRQVEVVKLYGSMELAPIVGLADAIVDVVDSGNTLKDNGLIVRDHIMDISSRLVVNRASLKMKAKSLQPIIDQITAAARKQ